MPINEAIVFAISAMLFFMSLVPEESKNAWTVAMIIVATIMLYTGLRGLH